MNDRSTEHSWGTPMPGQGRSRICNRCGGREAVVAGEPCKGDLDVAVTTTRYEYNPLEEDDRE